MLALVNTINDMIAQLAIFAKEVKKVAFEVGTEGKLGVQAEVGNVQGIWQEITYAIFFSLELWLVYDILQHVRQHDGKQSDHPSARFCADLGSRYGW